jgi:methyltransferase family protein
MLDIEEQHKYIKEQLLKLGEWFELDDLEIHLDELLEQDQLKASIENAVAPVEFFKTKSWDSILRFGFYRISQYCLVRKLKATNVIETGVLHGLSSIFTLHALYLNNNKDDIGSRLISIDFPSYYESGPSNSDGFMDTLPPGLQPGWIIDSSHKKYWDLRIGKSSEFLTSALNDCDNEIDIFIHDSEHSYKTMMYEFETSWPAIRQGGFMIVDNLSVNTSFFDFAHKMGCIPYVAPVDPDHKLSLSETESGIRFGILQK